MIDALPSGFSIYKVHFPRPIIYTNLAGLFCFVWAKDFDRKHGKYESNRRSVITRCDSLHFSDVQHEPARLTQEHFLSINGHSLWKILSHHAVTKPDQTIETDDAKLFFDDRSNALNDAAQWMVNVADQLVRDCPVKRQYRQ